MLEPPANYLFSTYASYTHSGYPYRYLHPDYSQVIKIFGEILSSLTDKEKLVTYTRVLRKIYEYCKRCDFQRKLTVNVVTTEGTIQKSRM